MKNYKIHLIRHGMTEGNKVGYFTGHMDVPVCEEGIAEINEILKHYSYPEVDHVYCSPLQRAVTTAKMIYPEHEAEAIENLKELSVGDFEGVLLTELAKTEDYQNWLTDTVNFTPPNAEENIKEFVERVYRGLDEVFIDMCKNNYTEAAVVCHGGVISSLLANFGQPKGSVQEWKAENVRGFSISISTQSWCTLKFFEVISRVGPALNLEAK